MNDGICILSFGFPLCTCMPEWAGFRCQTRITTTTAFPTTPATTTNIPCNLLPPGYCNFGICTVIGGRVRCVCPPMYTGNRCEILIGPTPPSKCFKFKIEFIAEYYIRNDLSTEIILFDSRICLLRSHSIFL